MSAVLLQNMKTEPLSLERECPHILRAFFCLIRNMEGFRRPLSYPIIGLHEEYIMGLARDKIQLVTLMTIAQNILITCWSTFPDIQSAVEHIDVLFTDVAAILGDDPTGQNVVVEKMESFIGRIAQRVVADMVCMHRDSELADMWFSVDIGEQRQAKCNEVCTQTSCSSLSDCQLCRLYIAEHYVK